MATFYLDQEGGNDANDGTSFANRWKTLTLGATAARIAAGDTIRVMGSPAPTSLGVNGTWTNGPLAATTTITSSTNATPIVVTRASHGLTTGDTVVITGHTTNTNANGTWEVNVLTSSTFELTGSVGNGVGGGTGTFRLRNNSRVMLASAITKSVQDCGFQSGAWTASANVTATITTTDYKEGYGASSLVIAAGFTTGLAAYKALGASTDFSAYKQITFWIKQTLGTIGAAGAIQIKLCSDTAGVTAVDTFDVPALGALNRWVPVTVDKGSALGAAIQSVAVYVVTDNAAQTFLIDNITAVKDSTSADSLSLTSLIGKNSGTESWCGIQSINGTRIMLDQQTNTIPTDTTYRGYSGVTETVTAYKRETVKTAIAAAAADIIAAATDNGTAASYISIEGGWDRTNMTTQNLETWFDGINGLGTGFSVSNTGDYYSLNKVNFVRYNIGVALNNEAGFTLNNFHSNNHTLYGVQVSGTATLNTFTVYAVNYNGDSGIRSATSAFPGGKNYIPVIYAANGNAVDGVESFGKFDVYESIPSARNNGSYGFQFLANNDLNIVRNLVTSGNAVGGVRCRTGLHFLQNASIAEATEVTLSDTVTGSMIFSHDHDQSVGTHKIFIDGGTIDSDTTTRHTASGLAWKLSPTSTTGRFAAYPIVLSLAKVACAASALVTVKAWMRRSNTGLTMRLVCKGGQISGVSSDQVASMTAAADTYEELTITFTPSVAGVVEITAEAYGGTTYNGYVDDMTITQA